MTKHFLLKVKEGKLKQWKDWCNFLMSEMDTVKKTLVQENAIGEYGILFKVGDDYYVYGGTDYRDEPIKADMSIELNRKHKEVVTECLEFVATGQELFKITL